MPTLVDLFHAYEQDYLTTQARSTRYNYQCFFGQVLQDLGPLPLEAVTPDVLRAWKRRVSRTRRPSTVHKMMTRFSTVLRAAVEEYGWLPGNPFQRVKKPSPGRGRIRFLSQEELTQLLAACRASRNPYLYALVILAITTGGRKEELRCLQWSQVDFEAGVVRLFQTKTDRALGAPLLGEALTLLAGLVVQRCLAVPWVFPRANGQAPRHMEGAWDTARRRAGLTNFHFHDLRHTFGSYMAMSGAALQDIAAAMGHRRLEQTLAYVHLMPSHTRGVVERMVHKFLLPPEAIL